MLIQNINYLSSLLLILLFLFLFVFLLLLLINLYIHKKNIRIIIIDIIIIIMLRKLYKSLLILYHYYYCYYLIIIINIIIYYCCYYYSYVYIYRKKLSLSIIWIAASGRVILLSQWEGIPASISSSGSVSGWSRLEVNCHCWLEIANFPTSSDIDRLFVSVGCWASWPTVLGSGWLGVGWPLPAITCSLIAVI